MPSPNPDQHTRPHWLLCALLCVIVLLCGFFARSSAPTDTTGTVMATAMPVVTYAVHTFPPPVTAEPTEKKRLTAGITSEPVMVIYGDPEDLLEETASPSPSPTPTAAPTATPTWTPSPSPSPSPTPSPRPGPTPTYGHATDSIRIEITRHELKNVVYFAAEIWLSDISQLRSAFSSDQFDGATEPVGDIAMRNGAMLAINGDFATFNNGGIIIRNGDVYRTNRSTRQLLVIDANGDFIPYVEPPQNAEEAAAQLHSEGVWQTLVFGPVLVSNGEAQPLPKKFFINTSGALEPRTAVGQLGPLHYLFLIVDGRQDGYSKGVSLPRLQELFLEHGAITAFNLDGGGSTTLYFDGQILNQPANGGQRHVPDILYIGE